MEEKKMYYSLFFEARSIQSYIFDSGKMKEMVGASELIKQLCAEKLDDVINEVELEEIKPNKDDPAEKNISDMSKALQEMKENQVFFSRRSGGAFSALFVNKDKRDRFLGVWSMSVNDFVPGLEVVYAVSESDEIKKIIEETYAKLAYNRNFPPAVLPEATPMHVLAPRTGKPAVDKEDNTFVWIDEASRKKIKAVDNDKFNSLSNAFLQNTPEEKAQKYSFPTNLEFDSKGHCEFPFKSDSRYLGLIHADGNDLGQTLLNIKENIEDGVEYAVMLRLFSENLEKSTMEAAQAATKNLIEQFKKDLEKNEKKSDESSKNTVLPMRPLVLGGDDLTVLVRADIAMQFVKDYCVAFKEKTKVNFEKIHNHNKDAIPEELTACAGLAYVKNNQPFMDAFELTESLCAESKRISKNVRKKEKRTEIPATVTSLVVTNSFIESYSSYKEKELTVKKGNKEYIATLGAYAIDENEKSIPTLKVLRALCKELKKDGVTSASIREYATMIFGDGNIAREKWRRWIEVLESRGLLNGFKTVMNGFTRQGEGLNVIESPWFGDDNTKKTPLFDALQLLSMDDIGDTINASSEGGKK